MLASPESCGWTFEHGISNFDDSHRRIVLTRSPQGHGIELFASFSEEVADVDVLRSTQLGASTLFYAGSVLFGSCHVPRSPREISHYVLQLFFSHPTAQGSFVLILKIIGNSLLCLNMGITHSHNLRSLSKAYRLHNDDGESYDRVLR